MKSKLFFSLLLILCFILFACVNEKTSWNNTKLENTIKAYESFIEEFPEGEYSDSASIILEELYFQEARKTDSIKNYENFLIKYPQGLYSDTVRLFIKVLDYKMAKTINSVDAFKEYINKYPDDSLAKKSQLIIDNFWIIKDINYSIVTEIKATCGMSKMAVTAEEGHIITINGNFSVPPNTNKSIMLSDIKLSGGYSDETKKTSWEFEPTAFGMGGKGSCSFYYEECIVKGAFSVEDLSGHGIKFDREKEGGPGELSIIGNIVPLCFAFPAPEIPNDYLYLTFEYRDFPIKLKAKND